MDLTEKTCPYCKTRFSDTDDVVICSACEMPHHKDCWIENQGCTTFGCQGTIQGVGQPADVYTPSMGTYSPPVNTASPAYSPFIDTPAPSRNIFCVRCGTPCTTDDIFCYMCGSTLVKQSL